MARVSFSSKRLQISKANAQVVMAVAIAAFVTTFSLVAANALLGNRSYQSRVIGEKEKAVSQLNENKQAVVSLAEAYREFTSRTENIIGGNPSGEGDRDGDNAKIILDALPSKYDFPAVTSSIEKILAEQNYTIESIVGTDDEVAQNESASPNPQPIEIPFEFGVNGKYSTMEDLLGTLERSIRPFEIVTLSFKGTDNEITLTANAKTYYQPEKSLSITKKVVE